MYIQWKDGVPTEIAPTDVFDELDSYLETNPQDTQAVRSDFVTYQQQLNQMSTGYKNLVERATTQLDRAKSQALLEYETTSSNRKGTRETIEHFSGLVTWYRHYISFQDARITVCQSQISEVEGKLQVWSERTLSRLRSNQSPDDPFNAKPEPSSFIRGQCDSSFLGFEQTIPGRPELGSNLGVFSRAASWLLQTESLELAQIVGMLGFGLLGSAISSLVLERETKRNRNQPIVGDLGVFIIRGATAAVVVFLAVKGGLAIFTSGTGEPSSYVLLLTCFIAAVFSEDVWKRTGKYLKERLNDVDDNGDSDEKDQGKKNGEPANETPQVDPASPVG
jgi:hypothetical protein